MTTLDAVNKMLRYIGELPVPTSVVIEDLPDGHEAKEALQILGEVSLEEQQLGWWFNTEEWIFLEVDGYITIPDNVISVKSTNKNDKYLVKDGQLYDVKRQSKLFTNDVTLKAVFEIDFDECPESFTSYVVYVASQQLHIYYNGDSLVQNDLANKISRQLVKLEREHMASKDYNLVKGTRLVDRGANPEPLA